MCNDYAKKIHSNKMNPVTVKKHQYILSSDNIQCRKVGVKGIEKIAPVDYKQTLRPLKGEKRSIYAKKGEVDLNVNVSVLFRIMYISVFVSITTLLT